MLTTDSAILSKGTWASAKRHMSGAGVPPGSFIRQASGGGCGSAGGSGSDSDGGAAAALGPGPLLAKEGEFGAGLSFGYIVCGARPASLQRPRAAEIFQRRRKRHKISCLRFRRH